MISSLNNFGSASAANLLMLFRVDSSSAPSNATAVNSAQSALNGASATNANDPMSAIKAILAQAQIEQGQTAALGGEPTRISIASGSTTLLDVGEASDAKQSAYLFSQTAEAYQGLLPEAQQFKAESLSSGPSAGVSPASAQGETNGSASNPQTATQMLLLTVRVLNDPSASVDGVEAQAATQAQQMVSAFQSGTVNSASADGSGFSFIGVYGPATSVVITGVQLSLGNNRPPDWSTDSTTCDTAAFQALTNQSTEHIGYVCGEDMGMAFTVPISK